MNKKNSNPSFSIITVVKNGELHIEQTIKSIIGQNTKLIEYILIDGGSTDRTIDIIKIYEKKIDRWISEKDEGIYDAMNKGLSLSRGTWIWYINSDDYMEEGIINYLSEIKYLDDFDVVYGKLRKLDMKYHYEVPIRNLTNQKKNITYSHQATLIKRQLLLSIQGFNTRYKINADYDLFLRLSGMKPKVLYVDKIFAGMRHGGASEKLKYVLVRVKDRFAIDKRILGSRHAFKNLFFYVIPGFFKKVFRNILDKSGINFISKLYFKSKYKK